MIERLRKSIGSYTKAMHDEHRSLNPLAILAVVIMICTLMTYIIPAGQYDRYTDEATGIELIDPDSFRFIERSPASPLSIFTSLTRGMQNSAEIIFYLLIIGGMFGIVNATAALNVGIANFLRLIKGKELIIIPLLMIMFGCGSAFCANFEEYLVFIPIILALCITSGFDSLTAIGIIFMAATAGYGGGMTNAFTVGRAQEIAGLPLYSAFRFRTEIFICLLLASIIYVTVRANIIKKTPKLSLVYENDRKYNADKHLNLNKIPKLTRRQFITLAVFSAGMIYSVCMVIIKQYYVDELSGIFLATGILCGICGKLSVNKICSSFVKGCSDMLLPCLVIGSVNAAIVLFSGSNVLDTILYLFAHIIAIVPQSTEAVMMFILHDIFNVIVPSGSAQATVTMPLMIPLADQAGITRQTAVIAYQLGDALTNVLAPTGGEVLAAVAICKIPYSKWVRYLLPLFGIWFVISVIFVTIAAQMHLGPF